MNIKDKLSSIKFKTLGYLIAFCIFILIFFWGFQIVFLNVAYERHQVNTIESIAKKISKGKINDLESTAYENEICIEKITNNEIVLYNSKLVGCGLGRDNLKLNQKISDFISSSSTSKSLRVLDEDYDVTAIVSLLKTSNEIVVLYSALEDISGASVILKSQLIYVVMIVIILAIAISYFISRKITDPILDISSKAKLLGEGKYDVTFKKNGIAEIDELAETLNTAGKELSKIDELRRDLMANVSHDLKTPLTMIKAYAEMIKDISYKNKNKLDEHVNIIISETDRLNVLVNDILELSKLQNDPTNLNLEKYDLIEEIKNIISKYAIMKETEKYIFATEMPSKAIIEADKKKLNQVIYNLLNNAINYTGKDKKITIKVTDKKKSYLVEIIDTGKGIKKEDIPYIWDRYYKNDKNHQRNIIGTGIGLSIVKETLEKHGFSYGVKSTKNIGSNFYFEIKK